MDDTSPLPSTIQKWNSNIQFTTAAILHIWSKSLLSCETHARTITSNSHLSIIKIHPSCRKNGWTLEQTSVWCYLKWQEPSLRKYYLRCFLTFCFGPCPIHQHGGGMIYDLSCPRPHNDTEMMWYHELSYIELNGLEQLK